MLTPVKLKFFNCSLNRKPVQCAFLFYIFFPYHFAEPNWPRENAATNAQNSSVRTQVHSSKSGIIEQSFS